MISVIVPAHNEARVIEATLQALTASAERALEVIVVCNGCTDDTAARARLFPAEVIEISEASKPAALNAGDAVAQHFPRFYVDADIVVTSADLRESAAHLGDSIHAVSPRMRPVTVGRPWAVRAFYAIWTELPYCKTLIGSGVFGLDEVARSRFDAFPQIIADDLYARLHVAPHERLVVNSAEFALETPRTIRALIKVKTRARLGHLQLQQTRPDLFANEDADHPGALRAMARDPLRWPALIAYCALRGIARARARYQHQKGRHDTWERDETIR